MKYNALVCACMLMCGVATAQDASAPTPPAEPVVIQAPDAVAAAPAPVPIAMETLTISGARRGLMGGGTVGDHTFVSRVSIMRTSLFAQDRSRHTRTFRYLGASDAPIVNGACILRTEGNSLLGFTWDQETTQLYACAVEDQAPGQFAFEVAVPAFKQGGFSLGGFSMTVEEDIPAAEMQAVLKALVVYRGVTYEALPTGFDDTTSPVFAFSASNGRRVVQGFSIRREGVEVGRVMFNNRDAARGTFTIPVSEADGREAVLFIAMQLHAMPDLFAPAVREEIKGG
jgi:hypothetical protein